MQLVWNVEDLNQMKRDSADRESRLNQYGRRFPGLDTNFRWVLLFMVVIEGGIWGAFDLLMSFCAGT